MMVVPLTMNEPVTCVELSDRPGIVCGAGTLFARVTDAQPDVSRTSIWWNCCGLPLCTQTPAIEIEYPIDHTDDSGRLCIRWDDLLFSAPEGRYWVQIMRRPMQEIARFQIDLQHPVGRVASATSITPNCESCACP